MCFTSARRSRRLRTGRSSEAGVFFAWWMSVDVCMPLWSWTDGRGQTSAACVRAVHMRELVDLDQGAAGNPSSGRWPGRRLVGLVGFGGLWTANRAPRNWLSGRRGEGGRSVLGAQTGVAGGTSGPNWGHNRRAVGGFGGFQGFVRPQWARKKKRPGSDSGAFYDGNTTGRRWGTGCGPLCPLRGALQGAMQPHRGGTCCRPGGI